MTETNIAKHHYAKTMDAQKTLYKSIEHYQTSNGKLSMKKVIAKKLLGKNSKIKPKTGNVSENLKQDKIANRGCLREEYNSKKTP